MEYLKVGKITSTFGIKGEVKIYITSSFPDERFARNAILYYKNEENYAELTVEKSYQKDKNFYIVKFSNFDSINKSELLINKELFVIKDPSILKNNEFFYSDLINLLIYDENDCLSGKVKRVVDYTPQLSLECDDNGKSYYIPFNDFFIKSVDLKTKKMVVHFIEGLKWFIKYLLFFLKYMIPF